MKPVDIRSEDRPIYDAIADRWGDQNTTRPTEYHLRSSAKVYYRCITCQQEYVRRFSAIVDNLNACAVCSGKMVIAGVNDLQSRFPRIAAEWSPQNEKHPSEVISTGGRQKAWFVCHECDHEWYVSIAFRVRDGNNCPRCAGQVIIQGVNDLKTVHPILLTEWNDTVSPENVFAWSNKQYAWKCAAGHAWMATPAQRWDRRTDSPRQCNRCARTKRRSVGETELAETVQSFTHHTVETSCSDVVQGIELDIYIPALQLAIEYNGEYWHSDTILLQKYGKSADMFHTDRIQMLNHVGVQLVYVWEHDWQTERETVVAALRCLLSTGDVSDILLKTVGTLK